MQLNKSVQYGLLALKSLRFDPKLPPVACSTICAAAKMPDRFVLQVLRKLVSAGIISSARGVNGGYRLAKLPHLITVASVVEALEGPIKAGTLDAMPNGSGKKLGRVLDGVARDTRKALESITLADL